MVDRLRSTYLRVDARSLGLFRIAMAAALVGDWWTRWSDVRAFYSNEGVLANHAHLYSVLRQDPPERVWSVFHAFSTPGENRVALLLTLLVYFFFLIGFKTRVFHVLSLALLVSLTGRNLLLEGPANHVAIALLGVTAFLPCGSRFSIDSLRGSFRQKDEKDAAALNDRAPKSAKAIAAERSAGWSPTSLAALAVLLQIAIMLFAIARAQHGDKWLSGTALHYGLWVERYVSDLGMIVRAAPPGLLKVWSQILRLTPWVVPVLLFVPAPRYARPVAFWATLIYGASYGLLFSFGLWGWTFVAAAFLVISTESWDAWQSRWAKGRALTVIYDADCGVCLWLTRLLKRLDLRGHLTFQGNDLLATPPGGPAQVPPTYRTAGDEQAPPRVLYRRPKPGAPVETAPLPAGVTDELVTGTVVVVDEKGRVSTEGDAIAAIVRSLPLGALLSLPLRIPGIRQLSNALYRLVPPRRYAISEALGMGACGLPPPGAAAPEQPSSSAEPQVAPSTRTRRAITGAIREVGAVAVLLASLAQTAKENPWPAALTIPQNRLFSALTGWSRMNARWPVLAPEPPAADGVFVVDAQTRGGQSIDPLTGQAPSLEIPTFRLGLLWSDYTARIRKKDLIDFEKAFRDYLTMRGGRAWTPDAPDRQIVGLDAYWLSYDSPAPGGTAVTVTGREKLFTHARGGKGETKIPLLRPTPVR